MICLLFVKLSIQSLYDMSGMMPPYLAGKCSGGTNRWSEAMSLPWKWMFERIRSLINGLNIWKTMSNTQPWLTMWISQVRCGTDVWWEFNSYNNYHMLLNVRPFNTYHHQTNNLLRNHRIHVPHLAHRVCLKVEYSNSAQHLGNWLQWSKLEQQQRCGQDVVDRHPWRLPFTDFVEHNPALVLIFEWCHRDYIIFAQRDQLHWIDILMEFWIVISESGIVL